MHDGTWLDTRVRSLIDPLSWGMTDRELKASGIARRRGEEAAERRRRRLAGAPPPFSRQSAARAPCLEPRRRFCIMPPTQWMQRRRELFHFLEGKPTARRAEEFPAHWKKLRKALDAKATEIRHDLELRERDLRQQAARDNYALSQRLIEGVARQIEALDDLPSWRVQWLVGLHEEALTEEALMGDLEVLNRRRAGLEFGFYEFQAVDPEGPLELMNDRARAQYKPSRTDRGGRYWFMARLTHLGLGVDVSSKVTADLLLRFGIEGPHNSHPWGAIKQWWRATGQHLDG